MDLKNIALFLLYFEIILIAVIFVLFILFRISENLSEKRRTNNVRNLLLTIPISLISNTRVDLKKIMSEKLVSINDLLLVMESLDKRISSPELDDLKQEVSHNYLLGQARKLATSSSWENRNFAARCFALFPLLEDKSTILNLIDDPVFLVHSIAAAAAVKLELKEGFLKIIKRMSLDAGYSRCAYQDILTKGSVKSFLWIEEFAATEKDPLVRRACLELLASRQVIFTHPFLHEAINSTDPLIRLAAAKLFAHNLQKDSEDILYRLMDDKSEEIRAQAAYGLGFFKTRKNIDRLLLALNEDSWRIRKQAAESLKGMGKEGLDALNNYNPSTNKKGYETIQYVLEFSE